MISDKDFCDQCHNLIHSLRLIDGYKPSNAETKLSRWVILKYKDTCMDCREAGERIISNPQPVQKGLLQNVKEVFKK